MFVISNRKAIHCLALLFSPLQTCVQASCWLGLYNKFQWHWRLVLSEEQAGSLQRPDDKQTQPPNYNKTRREGCSLVGRCSLFLWLFPSLSLCSLIPHLLLSGSLLSVCRYPACCAPLPLHFLAPFLLIPFCLPSLPFHPPPLCSGS